MKRKTYPLKRSDPLLIKVSYLLIYIAIGLWFGSLIVITLTGGF